MKELKTKWAQGLTPFDPGIRFSAVTVDILGPVTMATSSRAKHVFVMTDIFTMYTVVVSLVSTDSADVAREIVENCRLLGIDKTQVSIYKPKCNGQMDRHNAKMADVILKYCAENPRK